MKKHSMFSVAQLKAHAEALVDAVDGSREAVVITQHGTAKAVLQGVGSFLMLQQAVNLLERLAIQHGEVLKGARDEIDAVLNHLRQGAR
ncbi:type II toxin-antitoxin system prevent-host-death family antitoxin [Paraburkholderia terrae]|uniref:type II toxin-antitoxin system prevent-host-death family antitoxin n=1 Tax=Paraburkholderia terrae TaxID=311230 RepID=UPI001EE37B78|nr:type II toxin-antitoxin system prevent-host-death family antitoxin [Paraburkholderia terrae]GJH03859.1 type II toxin-antitoxin system prevent-host-death family antitoxin [Paraburkholderia terrae]